MIPYITVAEADTYFQTQYDRDLWFDTANDEADSGEYTPKQKALFAATTIINSLNFKGTKIANDLDPNALNAFPRDLYPMVNDLYPANIRYACAEIAYALIDGVDPNFEYEALNITSQSYSNIRSAYDRNNPPQHIVAGVPSIQAWRYLIPYLVFPDGVRLDRV